MFVTCVLCNQNSGEISYPASLILYWKLHLGFLSFRALCDFVFLGVNVTSWCNILRSISFQYDYLKEQKIRIYKNAFQKLYSMCSTVTAHEPQQEVTAGACLVCGNAALGGIASFTWVPTCADSNTFPVLWDKALLAWFCSSAAPADSRARREAAEFLSVCVLWEKSLSLLLNTPWAKETVNCNVDVEAQ